MNFIRIIAVALFMGLGVQGCLHDDDDPAPAAGGGGGVPPPGAMVPITAQNQIPIASLAVGVSAFMGGLGNASTGIVTLGAVVQASNGDFSLADFTRFALQRAVRAAEATPVIVVGVVVPFSDPCPFSGSVDGTWDDADNSGTVNAPDTISATLTACEFEPGIVADGDVGITNPSVTGDWDTPVCPCDASGSFTFTDVMITEAGETLTLNGGAIFAASSQTGADLAGTLMGTSLTVDGVAITSFNFAFTNNLATGEYSEALECVLSSPLIGGTIELHGGLAPFMGTAPSNPDAGLLQISGAPNSVLEIVALDATQVRLDLDTDFTDQVPGTSTIVLWDDL